MEPIRILCVFAKLNRGGAESMCMNLYRAIDKTKIQFDFVKHTKEKCDFEDEIISMGGKIFEAPRFNLINYYRYYLWWENHLLKHPEHLIVHGHYFTISSIYFKFAKKHNRITVAHSHSTAPQVETVKTKVRSVLLKGIKKHSDYYLSCSADAGKWLYGEDAVKSSKYHLIPNAIDTKKYEFSMDIREKVRNEFDIEKDCILIGTVGRMTEAKNPSAFIDICKCIAKEYAVKNKTVKFMWVGTGPLRDAIINRIREYDLEDYFVLPGVRSDVNMILMGMDAFILPSLWEGLPVVVVEAQASGLQCFISENITRDINISPLVHYLPINHDFSTWSKMICDCDLHRENVINDIIRAGFDIHEASKKMESLYLSMYRVECQKRRN